MCATGVFVYVCLRDYCELFSEVETVKKSDEEILIAKYRTLGGEKRQ